MFKGMTGRLHALIIVIILAMSGICAIAEFDASVNVSKMTVYASASSSAKTLAQLSSGAELTVMKIDGRWAKIEYKGNWKFWQHTDVGKLPGIKGYVDFNIYNGSYYDLKKLTIGSQEDVW